MDVASEPDDDACMSRWRVNVVAGLVALVLVCVPAMASAVPPEHPGPEASLPAKAKAYGRYCKGQSKKHVQGQEGTPFSQCVTAMAKLANGQVGSPKQACKALSKRHVAGEPGTPFSRCVKGAKKLLEDLEAAA
jgi:hypothetical protein